MSDLLTVVEDTANGNGNLDIPEARRALVKEITKKIKAGRDHHKNVFKTMREDMEIAYTGTSKEAYRKGKKYVANIVQRHVAQRVSTLYAKNPKASYYRRQRRDFQFWDGSRQSIERAMMILQNGIQDPISLALIKDYQNGMTRRRMLDGLGETLVCLFNYYTDEQTPSFKLQMKQCVRRAVVTGVGFVKLDFQRTMTRTPGNQMHIDDLKARLDKLEHLTEEMTDTDADPEGASAEELRLMIEDAMKEEMTLDSEGVIFGFPQSDRIIIDPACRQLQGFIGAGWVAEEHLFTPDEVEEIWKISLKDAKYTKYNKKTREEQANNGAAWKDTRDENNPMCCVWEFYNRSTGLRYFVMDGYCDFLEEPDAPNVELERFFPYYALVFNAIESDKELYPVSDVRLITPMQDDYNFAREGLREHRKAARPKYVTSQGVMEETDITKLQTQQPHMVIQVKGLQPGQNVKELIQPIPSEKIDPNLYITTHLFEDVQLVAGSQEANFGSTSKASATETSIAESSRMSSIQSNIDDLDDFLSDIARDAGQVMLLDLQPQTVEEIVGPGYIWANMTKEQVRKEVFLKIEAGSSGRPNKAAELANMERVLPYLIQIPGVSPEWLIRETLRRLDDRLDLTDAIDVGIPAITTMNRTFTPDPMMMGMPMMGGPQGALPAPAGAAPDSQGANGANNQPDPRKTAPGGQPQYGAQNGGGPLAASIPM